jgi:hypothetical protein
MPTRVLDLKAVLLSEFQSDDIRLHIPAEDEHSDYVCLSHCWGSSRCSQLTSSITLESNLRGISLSTLPKTFQDAVFVTRRLGFRFLWIDSFCIIQDDDEDWTRESAQMSMVYRNASLTIAATKATNDEERFSGPSQAGKTYELQLKDGKAPIKIYARRRVPHMISMLPELAYNNNVGYRYEGGENTPLLDRGWVYQERMLSRRVLHFGESELHWECLEDTSCECRLTNARMNGYKSSNMTPKQQHQSALDDRFDNEVLYHTRLMERWHLIVEEYSKLSLSYKKDIFPALSGVARQMQPCRQDSYLAGLWRKSLLHDLCWTRYVLDENKPPRRRRRTWRAPTWSWASINSRVSYNMLAAPEASDNLAGSDIISVAEILDCKCVPHGNDPTGRLVSAKINLRSTLVPAKLWIPGNSRSVYPGLDFRDGISADQVVLDVSIDPRVVDLNREHADASFWDSNRIFCLILARRLESYLALVLIKISDEQKLFHRIGFCTIKETAFSEYFHFVNSTILWIV